MIITDQIELVETAIILLDLSPLSLSRIATQGKYNNCS